MQIGKSGAATTSDLVAGLTEVNYGGTLTVQATGEALAEGDTFKLFDAQTYRGAFTTLQLPDVAPLLWDTSRLAVDGTIKVVAFQAQPQFSAPVLVSDGNLVLTGTGGPPNGTYYLLGSTNIALSLTNWIPLSTNVFGPAGEFTVTNAITGPRLFQVIQVK